jgi:hypothetical protein
MWELVAGGVCCLGNIRRRTALARIRAGEANVLRLVAKVLGS